MTILDRICDRLWHASVRSKVDDDIRSGDSLGDRCRIEDVTHL